MKKLLFLIFTLFLSLNGFIFPDNLKGYIVPEYYYVLSSENSELQGQNGLWLKRIYLGYNSYLGDNWSLRIRFEMNYQPFEKSTVTPYLKDAHIKKRFSKNLSLLIGLIEPPSFNKVEKFWGLRFIEKTPSDFFKFASSRDTGISLEGKTKTGIIYTIMLGNYGSNKGEWNKGKAIYGRIGYENNNLYIEFNSHYAKNNNEDIKYFSMFSGYKNKKIKVGMNYIYEVVNNETSKDNSIISLFGILNIKENTSIFLRYDHLLDYNFSDIYTYTISKASEWKARYLLGGITVKLNKNTLFSPNFKYIFYSDNSSPSGDFYFNLTFKASFKSEL